jgi:Prolyl oligopeptidase family
MVHAEKRFTIDLKTNKMHVTASQDQERSRNSSVGVDLGQYTMTTETVEHVDGMPLLLTIVSKLKLKFKVQSHTHTPHTPHRHDVTRTPGPFVLIGYGAYGIPVPVEFDPQVMALLESGFCVGYAHCRGGNELGAAWHAAGKGMSKCNTFKDFTACARYLIAEGYTSPSQLCGMGMSAGGLIMGYVANQKEQLFAALIMRCASINQSTCQLLHTALHVSL